MKAPSIKVGRHPRLVGGSETQGPSTVREPLDATVDGNKSFVRAKVSGQFPGSPVTLSYAFTIKNDKIARLEIR